MRHAILFGEAADLIAEALAQHVRIPAHVPVPVTRCADLAEAVQHAAGVALTGDVVLLTPGGTSFDAYRGFRGPRATFRHPGGDATMTLQIPQRPPPAASAAHAATRPA